jgi:hypothetical protein
MQKVILDCQRKDAFVNTKVKVLRSSSRTEVAGDSKGWRVDTIGLLRKHDKVYIPRALVLRQEIL